MPAIEVVISLLLVILFYSLLATVIMELFSSVFSLRAKHLKKTLRAMLSSSDRREELLDEFTNHPLYQQLSGRGYGKKTPPSYITSQDFRTILTKLVAARDQKDDWRQKLEQLPDEQLRELLIQYWEEAGEQWDAFSQRIEEWYDEIMDRASGWYKRNIQVVLIVLGLGIAVLFNVDIIHVYQRLLQTSQDDLTELVDLAQTLTATPVATPDSLTTPTTTSSLQFSQPVNEELYKILEANVDNLKDPLGIGWGDAKYSQDIGFWLLKVLGWLLTALCISKGAPFWFDLLKKMVNFRSTGNFAVAPSAVKANAAVAPPSADQPQTPSHRSTTNNDPIDSHNNPSSTPVG